VRTSVDVVYGRENTSTLAYDAPEARSHVEQVVNSSLEMLPSGSKRENMAGAPSWGEGRSLCGDGGDSWEEEAGSTDSLPSGARMKWGGASCRA